MRCACGHTEHEHRDYHGRRGREECGVWEGSFLCQCDRFEPQFGVEPPTLGVDPRPPVDPAPLDLEAIEAVAAEAITGDETGYRIEDIVIRDVPLLIAEVRRLRAAAEECRRYHLDPRKDSQ